MLEIVIVLFVVLIYYVVVFVLLVVFSVFDVWLVVCSGVFIGYISGVVSVYV